jgi:hypothetical protein
MQISSMQDLHSGSYQKKPRFLGCMQFDHDIAVLSIQVIISLHQRLGISIQSAFSQFLLLLVVVDSHRVFSSIMGVYEKGA